MNIAFAGTPAFAVSVLDALVDAGHDVTNAGHREARWSVRVTNHAHDAAVRLGDVIKSW